MKSSYNSFIFVIIIFIAFSSCSHNKLDKQKYEEYKKNIHVSENLYKSTYWIDRENAVISASKYPYSRSEILIQSALSDTHNKVRITAIRALSQYPSPSSYELLSELCQKDPDFNIRLEALISIGNYKTASSAEIFINAYNDSNWLIRNAAISGLLSIDHKKLKRIQTDYALKALDDDMISIRIATLNKISFTDEKIYETIKEELLSRKNELKIGYILALIQALQYYKVDDEMRKYLVGRLTDQNTEIRINSLRALKNIKPAEK